MRVMKVAEKKYAGYVFCLQCRHAPSEHESPKKAFHCINGFAIMSSQVYLIVGYYISVYHGIVYYL